jgi:hypothetical protein
MRMNCSFPRRQTADWSAKSKPCLIQCPLKGNKKISHLNSFIHSSSFQAMNFNDTCWFAIQRIDGCIWHSNKSTVPYNNIIYLYNKNKLIVNLCNKNFRVSSIAILLTQQKKIKICIIRAKTPAQKIDQIILEEKCSRLKQNQYVYIKKKRLTKQLYKAKYLANTIKRKKNTKSQQQNRSQQTTTWQGS